MTKNRTLWNLACGLLDINPVTALTCDASVRVWIFAGKLKKIPTSLQRSLVKMSLVLRICFDSKMNVVWTTYKIDHPNTCISIFYQPVIQAFHCSKFFEIRVFKTNLSVVLRKQTKSSENDFQIKWPSSSNDRECK